MHVHDTCGSKCPRVVHYLTVSTDVYLAFIVVQYIYGKEVCFLASFSNMQVLLEANDVAGISLFLAMLIACVVAILLLPIETRGKSLKVSGTNY